MDFRDFLILARTLAAGPGEAEWRSAVSRAYYGAFHVACRLLLDLGFAVPRADRAHAFVWLRLSNSGDPDVQLAGTDLGDLRGKRNRADYDDRAGLSQALASSFTRTAEQIVRRLDAARLEPTRSAITNVIRVYERDVLRDVTWGP